MTNFEDYNKEQLINLVKNLKQQQKYGLIYNEHEEDIVKKCASHIPVFEEVRDRAVVGGGVNHILIEGDNFPSLLALQGLYKNKIDMIYIDPPYNLGKDFVYNDNFVDKEDTYRHSKWLSFMKCRLEISRESLNNYGIIFISINDKEQAQLKLLCDGIFGEDNFVSNMIWHNRNPNFGIISNDHEYILVYAKNKNNINPIYKGSNDGNWMGREIDRKYINPDNDIRGDWRSAGHTVTKTKTHYTYSLNIETGECVNCEKTQSPYYYNEKWAYPSNSIIKLWNDNRLYWEIKNKKVVSFKVKKFKSEEEPRSYPISVIEKNFANTVSGKQDLKDLGFDETIFDYPKPVKLMKYIINMVPKDSIILDFFAGSGTTGQAVFELNKEDGGQRKCILITNNENNICEDITYQRCKKVIEGYTTPDGRIIPPTNQNLRYFKTNLVEAGEDQSQTRANIKSDIIPMICMDNDGYDLVKKTVGYEVYSNNDLTIAVLIKNTPKHMDSLAKTLKDIKGPIKVYQTRSIGGVDNDLAKMLKKPKIEVCSSVDDYVSIYSHSTYKLRMEGNNE